MLQPLRCFLSSAAGSVASMEEKSFQRFFLRSEISQAKVIQFPLGSFLHRVSTQMERLAGGKDKRPLCSRENTWRMVWLYNVCLRSMASTM